METLTREVETKPAIEAELTLAFDGLKKQREKAENAGYLSRIHPEATGVAGDGTVIYSNEKRYVKAEKIGLPDHKRTVFESEKLAQENVDRILDEMIDLGYAENYAETEQPESLAIGELQEPTERVILVPGASHYKDFK